MRVDGYTNNGGVQVTLTEDEVSDLITGLSAALYRDGEGAFGGGAGWKGEKLVEFRALKGALESTLRPRARA